MADGGFCLRAMSADVNGIGSATAIAGEAIAMLAVLPFTAHVLLVSSSLLRKGMTVGKGLSTALEGPKVEHGTSRSEEPDLHSFRGERRTESGWIELLSAIS
jgi:hypothetical protein